MRMNHTSNVVAENSGGFEIAAACSECWGRLDHNKWKKTGNSFFHGEDGSRKCDFCEMRDGVMPYRYLDLAHKGLFYVQ